MLANLLIGLREGLEASLIVGILVAYVIKLKRREVLPLLWAGVAIAIVVSLAVGAILIWGVQALEPAWEPLVAGGLSIIAAGLVTWMIFWMAGTARQLKGHLQSEVDARLVGTGWALVALAFAAVGREGVETALFIWATAQSVGNGILPAVGAAIGLALAIGLGYLIYRGMVRVNLRTFFIWSGIFLIIISAGILVSGIGDLQEEAGILPFATGIAYDVSAAIPEESWYGILLSGILGFHAVMTWLQVIVWVVYVGITLTLFLRFTRHRPVVAASPAVTTGSVPVAS